MKEAVEGVLVKLGAVVQGTRMRPTEPEALIPTLGLPPNPPLAKTENGV